MSTDPVFKPRARITGIIRAEILTLLYSAVLFSSLWLAYQLRFDFLPAPEYTHYFFRIACSLLLLKLLLLYTFGQYESLLTYFGIHDLARIAAAMLIASIGALFVWFSVGIAFAPPRAVILADLLISIVAISGLRIGFRLLREGYIQGGKELRKKRKNVLIIGAGNVGASLAKDFLIRRRAGFAPIAFFDDDRQKWGTTIHGIPVEGPPETIPDYLRKRSVTEAIIAMPSATGRRVREIVHLLSKLQLSFEIVPSYDQLLSGKVRVSQVRPVEIEDLLGRPPVHLNLAAIQKLVCGRTVLVTGAGGTIGSELCRQLASYSPHRLILVERCEYNLFQIEQELIQLGFGAEIIPLVADLLDETRIRTVFSKFCPAQVFHAAAHKHVPMMEHQPGEAIRNNTLGTKLLSKLALEFGVEKFLFISTDKAINPTSVMGATKRLAEIYLQSLHQECGGRTQFFAVRFGNVLGSSGSVIPTFKKQIAAGGPITVTHPDITRYFMTVQEAVGLVLQSAAIATGGEIFVLDMGTPIKIIDLARQLIELSGLEPDLDIEIKFTGLRPGEKLFEEINHNSENMNPTEHAKIFRFVAPPVSYAKLCSELDQLSESLQFVEPVACKNALKRIIPEYTPYLTGV